MTLSTTNLGGVSGQDPAADEELLRAYLEAYWLRPENALWMALRSKALGQVALTRPMADISCGDGIFTFLHFGGRFSPRFDVFQSAGHLDRVTDGHADMFDFVSDAYAPDIIRQPREVVDIGTDLKPALLTKAGRLGVYGRTVLHDNNHPLPLATGSLGAVYCNSAYWVADVDGFLGDLCRVIATDGRIVLQVKLSEMRSHLIERFESEVGADFVDTIGRGRLACWPSLMSGEEWEVRFAEAGLAIESCEPVASMTHAVMWDLGMRPFAPMLVRMTGAVDPGVLASVKSDWVSLCLRLLRPMFDPAFRMGGSSGKPAELQYVLRRA